MAKIKYITKRFSAEKLAIIERANIIIDDFAEQGFTLTVRQLYYQFVGHDHFPDNRKYTFDGNTGKWRLDLLSGTKNADPNYDYLGDIIGDGRLAGLIDWDAIVDRTRSLKALEHFSHPRDILQQCAEEFCYWKWENQLNYVEVWVEKDALLGIVAQACNELDVPFFSCRGYTSITEVHAAAMRLQYEVSNGKTARIIHLGDHDPSGIDMTRDIKNRINNVFGVDIKVHRVALNMDQVQKYNPPPNPAKLTDSRGAGYIRTHGEYSWELDALEPQVMVDLIQKNILHWRDDAKWDELVAKEDRAKNILKGIDSRWNEVVRLVKSPPPEDPDDAEMKPWA